MKGYVTVEWELGEYAPCSKEFNEPVTWEYFLKRVRNDKTLNPPGLPVHDLPHQFWVTEK